MRNKGALGLLLTLALWLGACASAPPGDGAAPFSVAERHWVLSPVYYSQSVRGHLAVMRAARPLEDWLADPATSAELADRLRLAQAMRAFASDVLALPRNASYTRYADVQRRAVVWNVVATPAHSLHLHNWCFPLVGCLGYKGFFDETAAREWAARLPAHWDVWVYPVPAYSTLGWTNWLGGDPLLNTFLFQPEGELARLIFHELAHQQLFVAGDMAFSESFATAVERLGGQRWLQQRATEEAREAYRVFDERRQAFRALTRETRWELQTLFEQAQTEEWTFSQTEAGKAAVMVSFRARYDELRVAWGGFAGYDPWVEQANNALFAIQASYDQWVPAFKALFESEDRDFDRFYRAARAWARLPRPEREAKLLEWMPTQRNDYSSVPTRSM